MPVTTRSMNINFNKTGLVSTEQEFYNNIKQLLNDNDSANCITDRMIVSIKIYDLINDKLDSILLYNPDFWAKFAASVYNKTTQFNEQYKANDFAEINKSIVQKHIKAYMVARKLTASFLKNYNNSIILQNNYIQEALENIKKEEELTNIKEEIKAKKILRRNISIVDYTGMDTQDNILCYDSDYN